MSVRKVYDVRDSSFCVVKTMWDDAIENKYESGDIYTIYNSHSCINIWLHDALVSPMSYHTGRFCTSPSISSMMGQVWNVIWLSVEIRHVTTRRWFTFRFALQFAYNFAFVCQHTVPLKFNVFITKANWQQSAPMSSDIAVEERLR
jgi:hypothetical protein